MRLLGFPFHSIALSVYPIAYLYSRNMVYIPVEDTFRVVAISAAFAAFFLVGFRLILKDWAKAGIQCSLLLVLFYSFGHVANSLDARAAYTGLLALLPWIWLAMFLLFSVIFIRGRLPEATSQVLNIASAVLIIIPLASIGSTIAVLGRAEAAGAEALSLIRGEPQAEASMKELPVDGMPDIYYIVFDGYERADMLREYYSYDSSKFIDGLKERGFYVVDGSRSNYLSTNYSLNTSLNLIYYHEFPAPNQLRSKYNLQTNYVTEFLREQGYQIVVFDSGSNDTNDQYMDIFATPDSTRPDVEPEINPFERLLARTTVARLYFGEEAEEFNSEAASDAFVSAVNRELNQRRRRITHAFAHLPDYASVEGPRFLFAHIFLPHFPFLYGAGGEELRYHENVNLYWYEVEPTNYVEFYNYQLDYLNLAVLEAIDQILAETSKPVVIILQSDHGDDHFIDWDVPSAGGVSARSAILNAIYFSDEEYETLYPTITPANIFRVVLNHWFGTQYQLLSDKVFFHEHPISTPLGEVPEFIDSCTEFDVCLPDRSS